LNERGVVNGFYEKIKEPPGNLANGAVYILSSELLKILGNDSNNFKDFSAEILPKFIGKIFSYETQEIFIDIGKPESYIIANKIF
jgi:mannose-1-phosphate guanylyltransferase